MLFRLNWFGNVTTGWLCYLLLYVQFSQRGQGSRLHCSDVIMGAMASQITSLTIVYSTVYSGADQRKHQSSASLAFVLGIHRSPVNSPHKVPVTRTMFPYDDVIMRCVLLFKHRLIAPAPFRITWPVRSNIRWVGIDMLNYQCVNYSSS